MMEQSNLDLKDELFKVLAWFTASSIQDILRQRTNYSQFIIKVLTRHSPERERV